MGERHRGERESSVSFWKITIDSTIIIIIIIIIIEREREREKRRGAIGLRWMPDTHTLHHAKKRH